MPRVAILCEYPTLNGGEYSLLTVLAHLQVTSELLAATDRWEPVVIAPPTGALAEALQHCNIPHIPCKYRNTDDCKLPRDELQSRLLRAITSAQPDIVHANSLSMARLLGSLREQIPVGCSGHLRDILRLSAAAVRDLNRLDQLVAVSQATREFHVQQGLHANKTAVIHNGVDAEAFRPQPRSGRLHTELNVPPNARLVLSVGQIGLRKGLDIGATALSLLSDLEPPVHWVLAGERFSQKAESFAFEQALANRFTEAGHGDRLHRLGYRTDIALLMNEADVLLHAAHQEPFGRVLLEAAAAGLPIVATDVGGTPEMLRPNIDALLVPPADVSMMTAALRNCFANPRETTIRADNARRRVQQKFTVPAAANQLVNVWQMLFDARSAEPPTR